MVDRHLHVVGAPRIVGGDAHLAVGEVGDVHWLAVCVDRRRVVAQPLQGDEERVRHLRLARMQGVQHSAVHLPQHRTEQTAGADVEEVHLPDDLHGLRRDSQLLPRLPQGALYRRLAALHFAAGEAHLAGLMHRGGADLVEQSGAVCRFHPRHQHGGAASGAHEGGDVAGVGPAQCGDVHSLYVPSAKIPPP